MKHTPLPWSYRGNLIEHWRDHPQTDTPQPQLIATMAYRTETQANAELVVRAVNSHQDLIDACKAFVAARSNADLHNAVKLVEDAIAKAEQT